MNNSKGETKVSPFLLLIFILFISALCLNSEDLFYQSSEVIDINGLKLHARIIHPQMKETIVFLHGFGAHTYSFNSIIDSLENYKILLYDRPGFGFSQRPLDITWENNPYDYSYQADLLKSILDYYNIDKAHIAGHSAGGFIALLFADKYPEYVEKLILINPSFTGRRINPLLRKIGRWSLLKPLIIDKISEIKDQGERIIEKSWFDKDKLTENTLEEYKRPLEEDDWQDGLYYLSLGNMPDLNMSDIESIDKKILIITSEYDSIIPKETVLENAQYVKNKEIIVFDSCGHIPHEEIPLFTADSIKSFLSE